MTRISKVSMAAIAMTYAFLAFYTTIIITYILSGNINLNLYGFNILLIPGFTVDSHIIAFGSMSWIIFVVGTFVAATPTMLCLAILLRILGDYYHGAIFTSENARRYRNIGLILVIDALIATTMGDSIRVLAATLNNPPGERILSLSVGSTNIYLLFAGTVMFTIALAMQEASRIHDENQLTV